MDRNEVCVTVRDTGPGVSLEKLPHLFEPFYTTKPTGMRMGLSICRSIVEDHCGRLCASEHGPKRALFQFAIACRWLNPEFPTRPYLRQL
jgi:signal transduction histidine kinase